MKTLHTPSPWKVSLTCTGSAGSQLGIPGPQRNIFWGYHLYRNETDVEAHANKQIMEAAPDLLEALQCLTREINLGKLKVKKDFSLINAHACATKAITRALGGE